MSLYSLGINGTTLSTSNALACIKTAATGAGSVCKVQEIYLGGEASSSTVARVGVSFTTAGGTLDTTYAPKALDQSSAASTVGAGSTSTTYGWSASAPSPAATDCRLFLGFNAYAGVIRWVAPPQGRLIVGGQGAAAACDVRSFSGTPVVSGHLIYEQA
jgi:hypothetical protein